MTAGEHRDDNTAGSMTDLRAHLEAALEHRYRVDAEVAEGGMALVFRARDLKHDRSVAIKVMKPELGGSEAPERFVREIGIASKLSHPHILPVYDSGEVDGIHYIVMPFVEDESLRDRLERGGAVRLDDAVQIVNEIASALSYAHERGLVHRDIKPENILLQSGHAIVTDFGIARIVEGDDGTRFTRTGTTLGTVAYMSPEQAAGDAEVDARTDVYALGSVLFEMLSGMPPFHGMNRQAVLAAKITGARPEFPGADTIPPTVDAVVGTSLAPDPEDRYPNPTELARALQEAVTHQAIETAAMRAKRARAARGGGVVAAVGVLGALAFWLVTRAAQPAIGRVAVLPFESERNDTTQTFVIDGMHEALILEMQQAGLEVIGRRSVMQYRDDTTPIREIASQLEVDAVLESRAFYAVDSVGLSVSLLDGVSQAGLWSADFGAPASGIVRLYRQVTRAIADEIDFALSPEATLRLASAPPVDPAAYEAYLNGKSHWNRLAPEDLSLARSYFERALQIAPDYALGHVGIAVLWSGLQQMGLVRPDEAAPRIREAVAAALASDSTIAEAHFADAGLRTWTDWDWAGGEASFLRAIALNPSYAEARVYYAHLLMHLDRPEEALEQARRAVEIEPVSPLIRSLRCVVQGLAGRSEAAAAECRQVLAEDPRQIVALDGLTVALLNLGRWDEHVDNQIVRARELGVDWAADVLERSRAANGARAALGEVADSMQARWRRGEFIPPGGIAENLAYAGRTAEALDWLERAYDAHDPMLPYLIEGSWPEAFRSSPRFAAVFDKMGLPPRR